jgi:basic amino acid/polyamine antiporter, APA family
MARRLHGLRGALDPMSIASVAYGEIASSLYFALGVVALYALGLTPWLLLLAGGVFLLVALSYAEGTTSIPETGGAATLVRRAFNDPLGFLTGWALLLDYLLVMALAALFVPHYVGTAVGWDGITDRPWDAVVGMAVIAGVAAIRLVRRPAVYRLAVIVAGIALASHLLIVALGFALVFSPSDLSQGVDLGVDPTWGDLAFALPVAMLAYTGLETVANLASETREPGRTLPRSLFVGIGAVVAVSVAVAIVGVAAYPAEGGTTALGKEWLRAPLVGIVAAFGGSLPAVLVDALRVFIGLTGALILLAAVTTSASGAGRLTYALGRHQMLPHAFGVLHRRTLIPPISIVCTAVVASVFLLVSYLSPTHEIRFLASLYSFGILLAFTAAQLAVIRLRFTDPGLPRPFRVRGNVRIRGAEVPVAALVGAPLTLAIWVAAVATHRVTAVVGPLWLLAGVAVYVAVRGARRSALTERVEPGRADLVPTPEGQYERILVPVKLGPIGDEVLATAIRLAEERSSTVEALHVIEVPRSLALDAELADAEERAAASIAEAAILGHEHGVIVEGEVVRARSIGQAILDAAGERRADLILLGSSPKWRRQSRFFSPTVDYVLRRAGCEVMVVAFPQGVLEEEAALA